jgi:hypothetical protein
MLVVTKKTVIVDTHAIKEKAILLISTPLRIFLWLKSQIAKSLSRSNKI